VHHCLNTCTHPHTHTHTHAHTHTHTHTCTHTYTQHARTHTHVHNTHAHVHTTTQHTHTHRLGGYPPFSDEIVEYTLHDQICQARYSFPPQFWKGISDEAIDLIKQLLTLDPQKRITTVKALEHPWMQDEVVIGRARKIMEEAASKISMPPPPLPVSVPSPPCVHPSLHDHG